MAYKCEHPFFEKCKLLFFFIFVIYKNDLLGQYYHAMWQPYNIANGLAGNDIRVIVKDDIGYVWIATENGISSYDGYNFTNFNNKTHPTIFKKNQINRIQKNGDFFYLYTKSDGLIKLQPNTLTFTKIFESAPLSISFSGDTTAILFESGRLEIKVKDKNLHVLQFKVSTNDNVIIHAGQIYLSLKEMGILRFSVLNPKQRTLTPIILQKAFKGGKLILTKKNIVYHNGHTVRILKNDSLIDHPELKELTGINFFKEDDSEKPMFIEKYLNLYCDVNNHFMKFLASGEKNLELRSICRVS